MLSGTLFGHELMLKKGRKRGKNVCVCIYSCSIFKHNFMPETVISFSRSCQFLIPLLPCLALCCMFPFFFFPSWFSSHFSSFPWSSAEKHKQRLSVHLKGTSGSVAGEGERLGKKRQRDKEVSGNTLDERKKEKQPVFQVKYREEHKAWLESLSFFIFLVNNNNWLTKEEKQSLCRPTRIWSWVCLFFLIILRLLFVLFLLHKSFPLSFLRSQSSSTRLLVYQKSSTPSTWAGRAVTLEPASSL